MELKDIEFEEAYVVGAQNENKEGEKKGSIFRSKKLVYDPEKYEEEETDYMVQMKINLYKEKVEKEELIKFQLFTEQTKNMHRALAYAGIAFILTITVFLIDKFANLSKYTNIKDISITDLKSVGAVCMYPATMLMIMGVVICIAWVIVLFKRSVVTDDPHDGMIRRRETIIKCCDKRIKEYNNEIYRLQMKLMNIK